MNAIETTFSALNKLRLLPLGIWRDRASPAAQKRVQQRLLRRTLVHAYESVPLYRRKFDAAGVHPGELREPSDLRRFPVTEKDEIRDAFPEGAVAAGTDLRRCRIQQTSGSSGQCMEIALDPRSDDARAVFTQRMYGMHGFRFWRRMAYLFPYELPLQGNLGLYPHQHIQSGLPPREIWEQLRGYRPHLLAATPSDLFDLCELDVDFRELGLRRVCVHSEPMSSDERRHLSARFGCPVFTNYYCNEVWSIAAECPEGRWHQFPDSAVLEIVGDDGCPVPAGEVGHVLVTSLHNRVQPFIRYRLGDRAAWAPEGGGRCACGRATPRLLRIEGRDDDALEYPDGRRVHPSKLTVAVKSPCFDYPGAQIFRDYRITQDGPTHVTVQIVPGRDRAHFEPCAELGREQLEALLGPPFRVDLKIVHDLERGPGGKRKIVECALRHWGKRS